MRKLVYAAIGAAVLVVVALVVFAACSGGGESPSPEPTGSASSAPVDEAAAGWTRQEIATALFEGDLGTVEDLGTAVGELVGPSSSFPAEVTVTQVSAGRASTLVRFTLANVDDSDPLLPLHAFNAARPLTRDIRDVALVDPAQNLRFLPFLGQLDPDDPMKSFCTCSAAPLQMSQEGQLLSATFPPLPEGTTTVSLELPGFPLIENLPVTRD